MIQIVLPWVIGGFCIAMLFSVVRLLIGPAAIDRVLALDTLYINMLALLVLLGIELNSAIYFEAALVIAMLGFVGTVALSRYLLRGGVVE